MVFHLRFTNTWHTIWCALRIHRMVCILYIRFIAYGFSFYYIFFVHWIFHWIYTQHMLHSYHLEMCFLYHQLYDIAFHLEYLYESFTRRIWNNLYFSFHSSAFLYSHFWLYTNCVVRETSKYNPWNVKVFSSMKVLY